MADKPKYLHIQSCIEKYSPCHRDQYSMSSAAEGIGTPALNQTPQRPMRPFQAAYIAELDEAYNLGLDAPEDYGFNDGFDTGYNEGVDQGRGEPVPDTGLFEEPADAGFIDINKLDILLTATVNPTRSIVRHSTCRSYNTKFPSNYKF